MNRLFGILFVAIETVTFFRNFLGEYTAIRNLRQEKYYSDSSNRVYNHQDSENVWTNYIQGAELSEAELIYWDFLFENTYLLWNSSVWMVHGRIWCTNEFQRTWKLSCSRHCIIKCISSRLKLLNMLDTLLSSKYI